ARLEHRRLLPDLGALPPGVVEEELVENLALDLPGDEVRIGVPREEVELDLGAPVVRDDVRAVLGDEALVPEDRQEVQAAVDSHRPREERFADVVARELLALDD